MVDMQARGELDQPAYKYLSDDIVVTAQNAVAQGGDQAAGGGVRNIPHPTPKPQAMPGAPTPNPKPGARQPSAQTHVQRRRAQRKGVTGPQANPNASQGNRMTQQERKDARHGNNGPVVRPEGKTQTPEERKDARHGPNRDQLNNKRHEADEIIDEIVGVGPDETGATGMAMEKSGKKATQIRREANRAKVMEITAQRMVSNPQTTGIKTTGRKAVQAMKEANRLLASGAGAPGMSAAPSPQKAAGLFSEAAKLVNIPDEELKQIVGKGSRMARAATILSVGYAAVKVATAEDKADEALKQGAPLLGGILATTAVAALGVGAAATFGGIAVAAGVLLAAGYAGSYVGDLIYEAISDKDDEPNYQPDQQV